MRRIGLEITVGPHLANRDRPARDPFLDPVVRRGPRQADVLLFDDAEHGARQLAVEDARVVALLIRRAIDERRALVPSNALLAS